MALFGSANLFLLVSLSVTSGLKINAGSGQNVTLPCRDPNSNRILFLEWTKPNLKWPEVLYSCNNDGVPGDQDEYFKNRVFLKNSQMKDGDLSVVLKNVTVNETGIYECNVTYENDPQRESKLISTISLVVFPPDLNITAETGDDVTLRCEDTNVNKVSVLNWTRTDQQGNGEYVSFRMITPNDRNGQPESFLNRVSLNNSQMKDRDLSVVLKNVTINDTGIYMCRVKRQKGSKRKRSADQPPLSIISLSVSPPGEEGEQGGLSYDRLGLIALLGLLLTVLVLAPVVVWICKKRSGSNQSSGGSNNQENPDRDPLI
ncbi:junctional adhesion molecule-like isoform X2 [Oryzias melastigma]|uniref:junctional adhesion molecule-like isoform X2 n=1 Tax=Oryzias melastigma TaxID=30732 RepID=UPI00168D6A43|nr:junctional adhesion molecule-like isoform X2 [Oryzias melastigma]